MPSRGGGLDILSGTTTLMNVVLRRNSAAEGSGIRLEKSKPDTGVVSGTTALTVTNALLTDHDGAALELMPNAGVAAHASVRYTTLISNSVGVLRARSRPSICTNSVMVETGSPRRPAMAAWWRCATPIAMGICRRQLAMCGLAQLAIWRFRPGFVPGDQSFQLARDSLLLDRGEQLADVATDHEGQPRTGRWRWQRRGEARSGVG